MYQGQINVRYAKSLFQLAKEKKLSDEIKKDIQFILETFQENEHLYTMLDYPVIKISKKTQILQELFKDKINHYTLSFLMLIVKNKREKHLKNICLNFLDIYARENGIKKAVITTAVDLSRTQIESIKKSIEKKFKSPVEMETKVDQALIGGVIIQVDDKQLDLSVSRQIANLRNDFLKIDFNNKTKQKQIKL